jgi:nitrite reductase/ring-hydroxylating ferredoxin subunit
MSEHDTRDLHDAPGATPDCEACPVAVGRRQFFQEAAVAALGAFITLGISRSAAAQLPVIFTSAIDRSAHAFTYAVPAANGVQIDRDAEVILVRWDNEVHAFNLSCPHQRTALRWNDSEQRFQCPKHHSQYTPAGEFITGRATRGMDRFAVRVEDGKVVVDVDTMYKQDDDPTAWAAATVRVA